jgi:hypothetical protein
VVDGATVVDGQATVAAVSVDVVAQVTVVDVAEVVDSLVVDSLVVDSLVVESVVVSSVVSAPPGPVVCDTSCRQAAAAAVSPIDSTPRPKSAISNNVR